MKNLDVFLQQESPVDCPPLNDDAVRHAEEKLGVRLPGTYLNLLRFRNGGYLKNRRLRLSLPDTSKEIWTVLLIRGLGGREGLDSQTESGMILNQYLLEQWDYPKHSVVFSNSGHSGYFLDYRDCGPDGEPCVSNMQGEGSEHTSFTRLTPDFATFLEHLTE